MNLQKFNELLRYTINNNNYIQKNIKLNLKMDTELISSINLYDEVSGSFVDCIFYNSLVNEIPNFISKNYRIIQVFSNILNELKDQDLKNKFKDFINLDTLIESKQNINAYININNAPFYIYTDEVKSIIPNVKGNINEIILIRLLDKELSLPENLAKYTLVALSPLNGSSGILLHIKL